MLFQNPYLALANRRLRILGRLELVAACAIVVGSVGCAHKAKTPLTEVEVAKPVRTDVPVYSEWIGTTVGYIDVQVHSKVAGYLVAQVKVRATFYAFGTQENVKLALIDQHAATL